MQGTRRSASTLEALFSFLEVLFHSVVRAVRVQSGSAALGILTVLFKIILMVAVFYLMFEFLGFRGSAIRGDFLLYLLSGVFLFLLHNAGMSAALAASNPVAPLMMHAPMTTMLNILAATLSQLYVHTLAVMIILFFIHVKNGGLEIYDPIGVLSPFLLAWALGVAIGLCLSALRPFFPQVMNITSILLMRTNMLTSGKFFVANALPSSLIIYFAWNPLFHCIDQARGALFVNYFPRNSSMDYPVKFLIAATIIGLMAEFWLRKNVSQSTSARR
ncbi:MAG: ABC transporter permease [Pseudomonadota bacterium]